MITIEDVNGAIYRNQKYWWYNIDTWEISEDEDFTNFPYGFCQVTRKTKTVLGGTQYEFTVTVNSPFWAEGYRWEGKNGQSAPGSADMGKKIEITVEVPSIRIILYMGPQPLDFPNAYMGGYIVNDTLKLNLKELNTPQTIYWKNDGSEGSQIESLEKGLNLISETYLTMGYVMVNLLKTDFQFTCNQSLTVGKVNKVLLGTLTDYKPNCDLVGTYPTTLSVIYEDKTIPVEWSQSDNDYVFNLDLTDKTKTGTVRFQVKTEANEVLNETLTDVALTSQYETIDTLAKLQTLFSNGGTGRLGANLTLTHDMTVSKSVYIIGNDKTITMNGKQFTVKSQFKADHLTLTGGADAIHQKTGSVVEMTDCTFTNCTGRVIECDIELHSLDNPSDFTTVLTDCTFTNNDMCILHGGELSVTNCTVNGKISDPHYPYFLYQTDGTATLLRNTFNITSDSVIATDIEFNPCIFICGETAIINGRHRDDWMNNEISDFISVPQNNTSTIDLTYHYGVIDADITLQSDNGYCYGVSGEDYVFKANVDIRRA